MARGLVVEADGGSRGNPGPAGFGALVRDAATGAVLAEVAEPIGVATNNVAEYRGLIAGLRAAHEIDPQAEVEVRMDSKLVVEQMSGRWQIRHPAMRPLALEAASVFGPGRVRYVWVPRERNQDADRLANQAMDAAAGVGVPAAGAAQVAAEVPAEVAGESSAAGHLMAGEVAAGEAGSLPPEPVAATTFVLLRHAATEHTLTRRFSGSSGPDVPLAAQGREQARRVAEEVARRGGVDIVVSSPLLRATQTAAEVATRLGLEVTLEADLTEASFGEWDGLTFAEVRDRWPRELTAWLASPEVAPPGGEPLTAVGQRVRAAQQRLLTRHTGQTVLLVTHVTPVKEIVRAALDAPQRALFRLHLDPASFSVVQYYADGNASLRSYNDTAHLR